MVKIIKRKMGKLLDNSIFSSEYSKSKFSKCEYAQLLMNAALGKDYVEAVSSIDEKLPNVDTLFWRVKKCASLDNMLEDYKSFVVRHIKEVNKEGHRQLPFGDIETLEHEVQTCVRARNWRFRTKNARKKLKRLYAINHNLFNSALVIPFLMI